MIAQIVPCSALDLTFGSQVTLQRATATYSQSTSGPFTVASSIDNELISGFGWAIFDQVSRPQTAAFETSANTAPFVAGTRLLFILHHSYPVEHALGRLRLAVTTSARTTFADGNPGITTPGVIGPDSIWTVLTPRRVCASTSAALTVLGDGSILAADTDASLVSYVVEADTHLTGITGVRLEALTHASLPFMGPGLNSSNGNFVLSEFMVRAGAPDP